MVQSSLLTVKNRNLEFFLYLQTLLYRLLLIIIICFRITDRFFAQTAKLHLKQHVTRGANSERKAHESAKVIGGPMAGQRGTTTLGSTLFRFPQRNERNRKVIGELLRVFESQGATRRLDADEIVAASIDIGNWTTGANQQPSTPFHPAAEGEYCIHRFLSRCMYLA